MNKQIVGADVFPYLNGLIYPIEKSSLIEYAKKKGACLDVISLMRLIEERTYKNFLDVLESMLSKQAPPPKPMPKKKEVFFPPKKVIEEKKPPEKKAIEEKKAVKGQKPKKKKKKNHEHLQKLHLTLIYFCKRWPKVFNCRNPLPLKIDIHQDIYEKMKDKFAITENSLSKLLKKHVCRTDYCRKIIESTHRYDLDGNECGTIDDHAKAKAIEILATNEESKKKKKS